MADITIDDTQYTVHIRFSHCIINGKATPVYCICLSYLFIALRFVCDTSGLRQKRFSQLQCHFSK